MKIAVVSKSDERGGGASVVASNLTRHYNLAGHESQHFHLLEGGELNPFGNFPKTVVALKWLEAKFGYRDHLPFEKYLSKPSRILENFDVVHLHDMSTVHSHAYLGWMASQIPTIWTIHDCSPFTAGCLYPGDCEKFVNTCGDCPRLGGWPLQTKVDRTKQLHQKRRKIISEKQIHFTAPSHWMENEFLSAGYENSQISFVPNGVDTGVFYYRDKDELRKKYDLYDHDGPIILFSAAWLADSRKGPDLAAKLVKECRDLNPKLILVGRYSEEAARIFQGLDFAHFGFVKNEMEKAEYFALADVALMLSDQENAPLTVLETMACGTPIFGLDSGGVKELMVDNTYKFVHAKSKFDCLIAQVREYLTKLDPSYSAKISEMAMQKYNYEKVAEQYVEIFTKKLAGDSPNIGAV